MHDIRRHFTRNSIWVTNKHMKRYLNITNFRGMYIKNVVRQHLLEQPKEKVMTSPNAGEDAEKLALLYVTDGSVKLYGHC